MSVENPSVTDLRQAAVRRIITSVFTEGLLPAEKLAENKSPFLTSADDYLNDDVQGLHINPGDPKMEAVHMLYLWMTSIFPVVTERSNRNR